MGVDVNTIWQLLKGAETATLYTQANNQELNILILNKHLNKTLK
jgi:hypothetical protein